MEADIILTVREEQPVTLKYVEAAIKPETEGHATPTYEAQTIYPAAGTVFGSFEVDPIPDPTDTLDINENGEGIDVRRIGAVNVNVQPTLQSKTVAPSEQSQTVEADSGYDGLSSVGVDPIPSQYIVPSGTKTLNENGSGIDVASYAAVDVAVPVPTMPDEYPTGGSLADGSFTGYVFAPAITSIRDYAFYQCRSFASAAVPEGVTSIGEHAFHYCNHLTTVTLPSTLVELKRSAFAECDALVTCNIPSSVTTFGLYVFYSDYALELSSVPSGITMIPLGCFTRCYGITELELLGDITNIGTSAFQYCTNCLAIKFLHCTAVPTLDGSNAFNNNNPNLKIVVPDSLVAPWKTATNWAAHASKIIGESDFVAS